MKNSQIILSIFLSFALFSCNMSFDENEDNIKQKNYDIAKMQSMSEIELHEEYPELSSSILLDDEDKFKFDLKNILNQENSTMDDLKIVLLENNIDSDIIGFMMSVNEFYDDTTLTRSLYNANQHACLDAYSDDMRQIRIQFAFNFVVMTPIGAYIQAKIDMHGAYKRRDTCMKNAG